MSLRCKKPLFCVWNPVVDFRLTICSIYLAKHDSVQMEPPSPQAYPAVRLDRTQASPPLQQPLPYPITPHHKTPYQAIPIVEPHPPRYSVAVGKATAPPSSLMWESSLRTYSFICLRSPIPNIHTLEVWMQALNKQTAISIVEVQFIASFVIPIGIDFEARLIENIINLQLLYFLSILHLYFSLPYGWTSFPV